MGCGVSGGEEGARYGPSLMPGGDEAAWCVGASHTHCMTQKSHFSDMMTAVTYKLSLVLERTGVNPSHFTSGRGVDKCIHWPFLGIVNCLSL